MNNVIEEYKQLVALRGYNDKVGSGLIKKNKSYLNIIYGWVQKAKHTKAFNFNYQLLVHSVRLQFNSVAYNFSFGQDYIDLRMSNYQCANNVWNITKRDTLKFSKVFIEPTKIDLDLSTNSKNKFSLFYSLEPLCLYLDKYKPESFYILSEQDLQQMAIKATGCFVKIESNSKFFNGRWLCIKDALGAKRGELFSSWSVSTTAIKKTVEWALNQYDYRNAMYQNLDLTVLPNYRPKNCRKSTYGCMVGCLESCLNEEYNKFAEAQITELNRIIKTYLI